MASPRVKQALMAAAGAAGDALSVENVFSTYVYKGVEVSGTDIVNNIDLSTEGGMVWIKGRSAALDHIINDTERGANNFIVPNSTTDNNPASGYLTAFNTNGFELGTQSRVNNSSNTYVSWTFRKAPKFFDVVTYSGNGSTQTINHNLGTAPGFIMIKRTNTSGHNWACWHRGTDSNFAAGGITALVLIQVVVDILVTITGVI